MGLTGRYDFKGIQKAVSVGVNALLASTSWGVWILASPFRPALDGIEGLAVNFLTNRGLIILNVEAAVVDGAIDEEKLGAAFDDALNKIKAGRDKLTPEQGKAIDDEVVQAFDEDADLNATDSANGAGVSDVPSAPFRIGNDKTI